MIPDGAEEVMLTDMDPEVEAGRQKMRNAYDEDETGGPSGVQCAAN